MAREFVMIAHFRTGGTEAGVLRALEKEMPYFNGFVNPGCQKCGGSGSYRDAPRFVPGSWNGIVLSCSEDMTFITTGDVVSVPKQDIALTEYIKNPRKQLGLSLTDGWAVAGDGAKAYVWERDMNLVFTREVATEWHVLGNMERGSSRIPTSGSTPGARQGQSPVAACSTT
jgi:hypothetical protein